MKENKLEQYYLGDEAWNKFSLLYKDIPNSNITFSLIKLLNEDELLIKVIEGKIGESSLEWIMKKIPALDNLRPIDCIDNMNLLNRLRVMLMRM